MFAASKTAAAAAGAPPSSNDPQFNYVTMLLHGDGTNGQQNNTFLDSSSNNFTITRNGTPTQGSVTPYWPDGQWSNYFSGTVGNYISVPDNAAFQLGSGAFTIEGWVNLSSLTASSYLMGKGDRATVAGSAFSLPFTGYTMDFYAGSSVFSLSTFTPTLNVWFHIAIVRNGTTITRYINGVSNASVTIGTASINTGGSNEVRIGGYVNSTGFLGINGYLSNLRVVKGTALYTSNFTPPTTPLTAVSGTSLLTCQSNRFKDNSSNNFAITVTGTPSVQRFSPFEPAAGYDSSVIGGSGYFNGSSYLSLGNSAYSNIGTGDFTIEGWWNFSDTANQALVSKYSTPSNSGFVVQYQAGNLRLVLSAGGVDNVYAFPWTPSIGVWNHIAITRSGTSGRAFINGTQISTTKTVVTNNANSSSSLQIGLTHTVSEYTRGYASDVRIVPGTALYTSNFTPPTAPLTAITNTSLLLNCVNAGIYDNAMMNDLVTVGDAQVSTAVVKYGTGSLKFDGTGDWLTFNDTPNLQLGSGNFTVEGWLYISTTGTAKYIAAKGTSTTGWALGVNSSNQLVFNYTSSTITGSTALSSGQWYHVAVVRNGSATGNVKIYLEGTTDATSAGAITDNFNQTNSGYIGADRVGTSPMNGYIDDLRITKGYARYTANFTPPTAPFPTR